VHETGVLPQRPIDAIRSGSARGIDLVVGTTSKELLGVFRMGPDVFGIDESEALPPEVVDSTTELAFSSSRVAAADAAGLYRRNRPGASELEVLAALVSDWAFRVPSIRLAEAQAEHASTYAYEIAWASDGTGGRWDASHALDLPLVFDTCATDFGRFVAGDNPPASLIEMVHGAWARFVRSGEPTIRGGTEPALGWPEYAARRLTMFFDTPSEVHEDPAGDERELWADVL
jgi:para-nitrobenzyl esterase